MLRERERIRESETILVNKGQDNVSIVRFQEFAMRCKKNKMKNSYQDIPSTTLN